MCSEMFMALACKSQGWLCLSVYENACTLEWRNHLNYCPVRHLQVKDVFDVPPFSFVCLFHFLSSCLMKDACYEGVCLATRQLDVVFNGLLWDKSQSTAHLMHPVCTSTSQDESVFVSGLGHERLRSSWGHALVFSLPLLWSLKNETFHMHTTCRPIINLLVSTEMWFLMFLCPL